MKDSQCGNEWQDSMAGRKAGNENEGQTMNCRETHQTGHDAGQHSKRKPQDVEQGQGHEGLLGIQDMGVVNEDIGCEGCLVEGCHQRTETFLF